MQKSEQCSSPWLWYLFSSQAAVITAGTYINQLRFEPSWVPLSSFVTLSKWLHLSKPSFSPLWDTDKSAELLRGVIIIHLWMLLAQYWEQCPVYGRSLVLFCGRSLINIYWVGDSNELSTYRSILCGETQVGTEEIACEEGKVNFPFEVSLTPSQYRLALSNARPCN